MEEAEELTLEAAAAARKPSAPRRRATACPPTGVRFDASNLVYRAALLLRERCGVRRGARIRLAKRIPSGAGMGGGSADAAAALKGLNSLWGAGPSHARSSCPWAWNWVRTFPSSSRAGWRM